MVCGGQTLETMQMCDDGCRGQAAMTDRVTSTIMLMTHSQMNFTLQMYADNIQWNEHCRIQDYCADDKLWMWLVGMEQMQWVNIIMVR